MLRQFCESVSEDLRRLLYDPPLPFPFANLEWPQRVRKAHGVGGARMPRIVANTSSRSTPKTNPSERSSPTKRGTPNATQRITAADLRSGQIRIPQTTFLRPNPTGLFEELTGTDPDHASPEIISSARFCLQ